MNHSEATKVVNLVKQACPSQKFEEMTAAVWQGILEDVSYRDAALSVKDLGKRLEYIAPRDIIAEVKIIRRKRLEHVDRTFTDSKWYPQEIEGESEAAFTARELMAKRDYIKAVGDGHVDADPPLLEQRYNPQQLMPRVFRAIEEPPRSLLPAQKAGLSPRAAALLRKRLDEAQGPEGGV